jgi:hypothetical protein
MALSLDKPLRTIMGILLIYDLCVAGLWHQFGYHTGQVGTLFGLVTMFLNNFGFPAFFILMVYKHRPNTAGGWWTLGAYVACWFPLIINVVINHVVYTHVTGYYHAMMTSTVVGAKEGLAVYQFLTYMQCAWLTLFMSLFMAWRNWWVRTYG